MVCGAHRAFVLRLAVHPISSEVDVRAEKFRRVYAQGQQDIAKLHLAFDKALHDGERAAKGKPQYHGRLLPRARIELLLDPGSYFLEIAPLAGANVVGHSYGAGIIGGIGRVCGVDCMITANDYVQKGGAVTELGVHKTNRLAEIALENSLPSISLIESAGADLPNQAKIFLAGGKGFRDLSLRSKNRLPTVCLVFGSSTAGGAYIPGMSDYVVM